MKIVNAYNRVIDCFGRARPLNRILLAITILLALMIGIPVLAGSLLGCQSGVDERLSVRCAAGRGSGSYTVEGETLTIGRWNTWQQPIYVPSGIKTVRVNGTIDINAEESGWMQFTSGSMRLVGDGTVRANGDYSAEESVFHGDFNAPIWSTHSLTIGGNLHFEANDFAGNLFSLNNWRDTRLYMTDDITVDVRGTDVRGLFAAGDVEISLSPAPGDLNFSVTGTESAIGLQVTNELEVENAHILVDGPDAIGIIAGETARLLRVILDVPDGDGIHMDTHQSSLSLANGTRLTASEAAVRGGDGEQFVSISGAREVTGQIDLGDGDDDVILMVDGLEQVGDIQMGPGGDRVELEFIGFLPGISVGMLDGGEGEDRLVFNYSADGAEVPDEIDLEAGELVFGGITVQWQNFERVTIERDGVDIDEETETDASATEDESASE